MRTPALMIIGIVFAPCGWIFDLTSTVAPDWREIRSIPGQSSDTFLQQGIWDICKGSDSSRTIQCNQPDTAYFQTQIVNIAKGMMIASLLVTILGIAVTAGGIRCWTDNYSWKIAGLGGILILISGVLCLIPIAWYTYLLNSITASGTDIRVGYCIVLGYIGSIMEILGGGALIIGMYNLCCGKKREEEKQYPVRTFRNTLTPRPAIRPFDVISRASDVSSVPYARESMDEGDFTRPPKTQSYKPNKMNNISCDSDL
ncbi:CLD23 protein, partial [Atractosteus spatula]|nr:CLD23 protein [Atractosteus spatula]